jgi:hypothetical protein
MIKRLLKIILFIPCLILSGMQLPYIIIWFLFKGEVPTLLLEHLFEW